MANPIIRTNNISVVYGSGSAQLRALDGVNIEIFPEEYIIFFGPSGCGKSTLLYTIAGLEKTTEGTVTVSGKVIATLSREEMVTFHRNTIGMIFQAYYLISSLSVLQNVALPQIFASKDTATRETRANSLLKRFGILEQAQKLPTSLSGGQQQRVAIARSLANNAPIILADEPVGNLDSKSADVVLELLKDLNKTDKKTVIMVTHNPSHLHYADRVFYMKDGKVIREVRNENVKPEVKQEEQVPLMNFGLQEYAKLFPHLSEEELKAKMLTAYVLGEIDIETEEKLEKLVGEYMRHHITDDQFLRKVTRPIKNDGLGLYHAFAERLLHSLKKVLDMAEYLVREYGSYPKTYAAYDAILTRLADYLYAVTEHHPTPEDRELVKKVLKSRLEGALDHDGFQEFLDRPTKQGGAGLNIRTARNFARQFELILLGFEERTRKSAHATPHLFGLKSIGGDAKKTSQTMSPVIVPMVPTTPPAPPLAQRVDSHIPPTVPLASLKNAATPKPAPSTGEGAVSRPTHPSLPALKAQPEKPAIPTILPTPPRPTTQQTQVPTSQPGQTKTVEETIQFFPTTKTSTQPVAKTSFLSSLTHLLHKKDAEDEDTGARVVPGIETVRSQHTTTPQLQKSAPMQPQPRPAAPILRPSIPTQQQFPQKVISTPPPIPPTIKPPSIALTASSTTTTNVTNTHASASAPKSTSTDGASQTVATPPSNTPKTELPLAQKPQASQQSTPQTRAPSTYNAPMIFPQKLNSFTQEKHEGR